jgi:8-oxo-dGTP pyrophosphatase MutT (NUDIX family)
MRGEKSMEAKSLRVAKRREHVVAVLIISPEGIPLVRDLTKSPPLWKVPGGHGDPGEFVEQVAVREVKEEINLSLRAEDLELCDKKDGGSHILSFFVARVATLRGIKGKSDEGLDVRVFSAQEILSLTDFFPRHRKIFETVINDESVGRAYPSE